MAEQVNSAAPAASPATSTDASNQNTNNAPTDTAELETSDDEGEEVAEPVTKEEKKAEAKRIKRLKLKVDGKEYDEELPFEIDEKDSEWMIKQLQLSKVSQKRMQEHSQLEKDVVAFIEELRNNPRKALSNPEFGIDVKKLAAEIIENEIENSKKTPEQIKAEKLEEELRALKAEREEESKSHKQRELERLQAEAYERYDTQVSQALEKSDLPKSPYVVKKMADYMLMALEEGHDVSPQDVLPLVREEILNDVKDMFAVMPEEVLEGIIGKDVVNRLRKKNLAKVKAGKPATPVNSSIKDTGGAKSETKAVEKQSFKNFFGV